MIRECYFKDYVPMQPILNTSANSFRSLHDKTSRYIFSIPCCRGKIRVFLIARSFSITLRSAIDATFCAPLLMGNLNRLWRTGREGRRLFHTRRIEERVTLATAAMADRQSGARVPKVVDCSRADTDSSQLSSCFFFNKQIKIYIQRHVLFY